MEFYPTNRFKIFLSGLFFVYLILDAFQKISSLCLALILLLGFLVDSYFWHRFQQSQKTTDRVSSIPPQENSIFLLLGNLMRSQGLEMRLRRAEFLWNVTLIKNSEGITHMMARGSAPSISEAIMRAEGDFEKRNEPEAS